MPPTNHTVTMTAMNGAITYSTANKRVKSGDYLQWICNVDFAILFAKKSPFTPDTPYQTAPASTSTPLLKIKKSLTIKSHKYLVAAYAGGNSPILIDDPQIIIDNSGGGGGGGKRKSRRATKKSAKRPAKKVSRKRK